MPTPKKRLSAAQAIKFYCRYICCANDTVSWKNCPVLRCSLNPHRFGKRVNKNHTYTLKKSLKSNDRGELKNEM